MSKLIEPFKLENNLVWNGSVLKPLSDTIEKEEIENVISFFNSKDIFIFKPIC